MSERHGLHADDAIGAGETAGKMRCQPGTIRKRGARSGHDREPGAGQDAGGIAPVAENRPDLGERMKKRSRSTPWRVASSARPAECRLCTRGRPFDLDPAHDEARIAGDRQLHHGCPVIGCGDVCVELVGRCTGGNEEHAIEPERLANLLGDHEVAEMDGVEVPPRIPTRRSVGAIQARDSWSGPSPILPRVRFPLQLAATDAHGLARRTPCRRSS